MLQHPMMLPYRNHLIHRVANVPEDEGCGTETGYTVPEGCVSGETGDSVLEGCSIATLVMLCPRAVAQRDCSA